jgi:hypothetical protein
MESGASASLSYVVSIPIRAASYALNEPQKYSAPFIRMFLANEWEATALKRILFKRSLFSFQFHFRLINLASLMHGVPAGFQKMRLRSNLKWRTEQYGAFFSKPGVLQVS